jgi:multidrug efflux pump
VGIALVLSAVLLPMAFFGGSTGVIYRQFSVTIVASMLLSVLVALVLSPALCATMLKPGDHDPLKRHGLFGRSTAGSIGRRAPIWAWWPRDGRRRCIWACLAITLAMALLFVRLPTGFLPNEDQGGDGDPLPAGATAERTDAVIDQVQKYYLTAEKKRWPAMAVAASASTVRGRTRAWALSRWCRLTSARARKARSMRSTCAR